MTLREKAAGLIVPRIGSNLPPPRRAEEEAEAVERLVAAHPVAGLILFNGGPEVRETLRRVQRAARRPLLVMTDMERGLGQQAAGGLVFPHAMAFGRADDEAATEAFGRFAAREAVAHGVHVALAPVADVNRDPMNPIIATRAFGTDAKAAARHTAAYVRGAHGAGLLTCAKHFPGHGNTHEDSHATLPTVRDDRATLEREEWPPFLSAIDAGCELVMTAHVAYPSLDPSGRPATLSRTILTDLLRGELGFEGVVVSDSLHMAGIQEEGRTEADLAVEQVAAGVDLLLDPHDTGAIVEGLAAAVEAGGLPEARLDEALARVERLRKRIESVHGASAWTELPSPPDDHAEADRLARRVARAALRTEGTLPFRDGDGLLAVLMQTKRTHLDPPEQPVGAALRGAFQGVAYHEIGPEGAGLDAVRQAASSARAMLLLLAVKPSAWHAFGLPEQLAEAAHELVAAHPAAVVALGSERALDGFEAAPFRAVTFSDVPAAQEALVEWLAGEAGA